MGELIEGGTHRGFRTSLGRGDPCTRCFCVIQSEAKNPDSYLSLSEERSARAEGERRERCNAGRSIQAGLPGAASQKVMLPSRRRTSVYEL
jgi:hypothetical protein